MRKIDPTPQTVLGTFLLDVSSAKYAFSQMKLRVSKNDSIAALEYAYPGAIKAVVGHPLVLQGHAKVSYFEKKEEISVIRMITGNPMMIMMVLSFGVMMYMPKMMEGMDKEQLKELQEQQGDPMKNMKKLFGMDGASSKQEDEDD